MFVRYELLFSRFDEKWLNSDCGGWFWMMRWACIIPLNYNLVDVYCGPTCCVWLATNVPRWIGFSSIRVWKVPFLCEFVTEYVGCVLLSWFWSWYVLVFLHFFIFVFTYSLVALGSSVSSLVSFRIPVVHSAIQWIVFLARLRTVATHHALALLDTDRSLAIKLATSTRICVHFSSSLLPSFSSLFWSPP